MADSAETPEAPVLSSVAGDKDAEMVHIFTLEDKEYFIPAKPRLNIGLKYMYEVQSKGEVVANSNMLVSLLGQDNYEALIEYEDLTPEILETILTIAGKVVFGESTITSPN